MTLRTQWELIVNVIYVHIYIFYGDKLKIEEKPIDNQYKVRHSMNARLMSLNFDTLSTMAYMNDNLAGEMFNQYPSKQTMYSNCRPHKTMCNIYEFIN